MAERQFGLSDLGEAEDRLRNLAGFEGVLPIEPAFKVTPVWILGDATSPGMAPTRGRRWAFTEVGLISGFQVGLAAQQDVIIERMDFSTGGGSNGGVVGMYMEPSPSLVVGANTALVMLDRMTGSEQAPIFRGMGGGGPFGRLFAQWNCFPGDGFQSSWQHPFCLRQNQTLNVRWVAAAGGTITVNIQGRVF